MNLEHASEKCVALDERVENANMICCEFSSSMAFPQINMTDQAFYRTCLTRAY